MAGGTPELKLGAEKTELCACGEVLTVRLFLVDDWQGWPRAHWRMKTKAKEVHLELHGLADSYRDDPDPWPRQLS